MPRGRRRNTLVDLANQFAALDEQIFKLKKKRAAIAEQVRELAVSHAMNEGGTRSPSREGKGGRRKGFKLSAEARAKIAAAQRKRWAKQKAAEK
jgi:hypothetical protein